MFGCAEGGLFVIYVKVLNKKRKLKEWKTKKNPLNYYSEHIFVHLDLEPKDFWLDFRRSDSNNNNDRLYLHEFTCFKCFDKQAKAGNSGRQYCRVNTQQSSQKQETLVWHELKQAGRTESVETQNYIMSHCK